MHEDQVETTAYSISALAPQPERRADERFVSLLRVGAIVAEGRRELCLVRNISAGGMMIRAYSPLAIGTPIAVEFKHGDPVKGVVHWVENGLTGVRFDAPIDVLALLAADSAAAQPRLPRIEVECGARLRQQARVTRGSVVNISQGGMCVRSATQLDLGGDIVATLPGLAPAAGVVRWNSGDSYGIAFNRPLALAELVDWLRERQGREAERLAG